MPKVYCAKRECVISLSNIAASLPQRARAAVRIHDDQAFLSSSVANSGEGAPPRVLKGPHHPPRILSLRAWSIIAYRVARCDGVSPWQTAHTYADGLPGSFVAGVRWLSHVPHCRLGLQSEHCRRGIGWGAVECGANDWSAVSKSCAKITADAATINMTRKACAAAASSGGGTHVKAVARRVAVDGAVPGALASVAARPGAHANETELVLQVVVVVVVVVTAAQQRRQQRCMQRREW